MERHFCPEDRTWLDFEGECSWCGMTELDAKLTKNMTSDEKFRRIMERLEQNARPNITDD